MVAGYVLALREGLEAALIVGVVLSSLRKMRREDLSTVVWLGVGAAIALSLAAGLALASLGAGLEGRSEKIFEATTLILAAGVLTWMIFWMRKQGSKTQVDLRQDVARVASAGQRWGLFAVAFFAVLREGVETGLFLTAAMFASRSSATVLGGLLGLASAGLLGVGLYAATVRLDLRMFFSATGILLLLFAAGLVSHAMHELNDLGWVPAVIHPLWNAGGILSDESAVGQALSALLGYEASPSLSQVLAYAAYFITVGLAVWPRRPRNTPQRA
jgi:high-affinity iron transporter